MSATNLGNPNHGEGKTRLKDVLVALSLSNLAFLRAWTIALDPKGNGYHEANPHSPNKFWGLMLLTVCLAMVLFAAIRYFRSLKASPLRTFGLAGFCFLSAFPVVMFAELVLRKGFRVYLWNLDQLPTLTNPRLWVVAMLLPVLWLTRRQMPRLAYRLLLGSSLVVLVTFTQAVVGLLEQEDAPASAAFHTMRGKSHPAATRVWWFVLDELDYHALFVERPRGLMLTNLDWFAAHSVSAQAAYSPSGDTLHSLPALLSGKRVERVERLDDTNLSVLYAGDPDPTLFPSGDNLIDDEHVAGRQVGVIGWYHPYTRWFPAQPGLRSAWRPFAYVQPFARETLGATMTSALRYNFLPGYARSVFAENYQALHDELMVQLQDARLDLGFFHLPIPHLPAIYDPARGKVGPQIVPGGNGYAQNLALLDKVLGEVREHLCDRNTAVILSSDHWLRSAQWKDGLVDHRIPFLVHFSNDGRPMAFTNEMNTVMTGSLVREILNGKIHTHAETKYWLQTHGSNKQPEPMRLSQIVHED